MRDNLEIHSLRDLSEKELKKNIKTYQMIYKYFNITLPHLFDFVNNKFHAYQIRYR